MLANKKNFDNLVMLITMSDNVNARVKKSDIQLFGFL